MKSIFNSTTNLQHFLEAGRYLIYQSMEKSLNLTAMNDYHGKVILPRENEYSIKSFFEPVMGDGHQQGS